ncbi:vegetative incompatibility protein het-e-1 [Fusarium avenaceum]|nr:vegetative incompatibility protein het-e-1 [Fusarium avenaceum]
MPLLYGEGKRAFFRLQEEIIKSCNDHTIFCWDWNADVPGDWASLLAPWPTAFEGAGEFEKLTSNEVSVFSMTNAGLSIRLPVIHTVATLWRIGSNSWFIMLQAAPASTILDHPESACIRVWGDKIGDVLYVSRDPYPPRPITISRECVRNFRVESLLVMNKIANGQVRATKGRKQNIDDPKNFNFIPIFDSLELAQRWKFENTYGEGAKASHLYGAITISSEKQVAVVLTDMRAIPGKCEASLPYVLLGVKPKHDSYYASAKLIKARQGNSALESPRLDKTLRSWRQKVMMGGSIAPGGYYNKKLRITTVLEQSMDVIRQRRNYNFLCFYQGKYYVSGNSQLADSQEDQGNGGDDSDIASNVAVAPNSDWNL